MTINKKYESQFGKLWDAAPREMDGEIETAIMEDVLEWQNLQLQLKALDERMCAKIKKITAEGK